MPDPTIDVEAGRALLAKAEDQSGTGWEIARNNRALGEWLLANSAPLLDAAERLGKAVEVFGRIARATTEVFDDDLQTMVEVAMDEEEMADLARDFLTEIGGGEG